MRLQTTAASLARINVPHLDEATMSDRYQQNPQQYDPYQQYSPVSPTPANTGIGIAAMVLGIVAIVFAFIPVVGLLSFLLAPLAIILGIIAVVKRRGRGQGITGVVTGAVGLVIATIGVALAGAIFISVDDEMQNLEESQEEAEEEIEAIAEADDAVEDADIEEIEEEVAEEEAPAEEVEASGEWVEVATLSGTGNQRGEVFEVTGDVRLSYEFNGDDDFGIAGVYLMDEGSNLTEDGGLPEVMLNGSDSGETMIYRSAGNYYLDVTAANYSDWTVTVEEQQ
ncbi:DUF4190 domain-containing protein [Nesterenkonia sp. DZ6]|uniref:DUF4190 domain-containing protein n=1 Tax=Nesterenkonia sp. DZ6 TaxID=2901229 RepID=UPI001F4C7BB4|nr:DUF4190 domain-containing protein [Nesterenkonia sp. DZ6]MCH8561188.1 DUF4190 domain-containing protein [Nesterenkonia sp. DZ6]